MVNLPARAFVGIKELRIKNYRSIRGDTITLEPLTIFVGPNGAGKSNVVGSLGFLRRVLRPTTGNAFRKTLRAVGWRNGLNTPPRSVGMSVTLSLPSGVNHTIQAHYGFEYDLTSLDPVVTRERCVVGTGPEQVYFDRQGQDIAHNLGFEVPPLESSVLVLPLLAGLSSFGKVYEALVRTRLYSVDPDAIRKEPMAEPPYSPDLDSNGENLCEVLAYLQRSEPAVLDRIKDHLIAVVPNTTFELDQEDQRTTLRFVQETSSGPVSFTPGRMSDGTLHSLGLLTAAYQTPAPFVTSVEEPESRVYPGALGVLLDIMSVGAERGQLLITTHSPDVLDWRDLRLESLRLVEWVDGETKVKPVGAAASSMMKEHLMSPGELLRANALYPDPDDNEPAEVDLFPEMV